MWKSIKSFFSKLFGKKKMAIPREYVLVEELDSKQYDNLKTKLIAGANITITPNDTTKEIIIASSGLGESDPSDVNTFAGRAPATGNIAPQKSDYSGWFVDLLGEYDNPSWLLKLAWSKITSKPTTIEGYGITDAVTASSINTFANKTINGDNNPLSNIPQSAVTNLSTDLGNKLNSSAFGLQPEITLTVASNASTWNMALGVNAIITISGNVVITITAASFLGTYAPALRIVQTGVKGYTVTFVYSGAVVYYSGGVGGNILSATSGYRALAALRLVNNEIEVSIDSTYTTTP